MFSQLTGIISTIFGAFFAILSFASWCIDVSRDPLNKSKRHANPTSPIAMIVYIGEFLDTFVSQPVYLSRPSSAPETSTSSTKTKVITNVHLYLGRADSALIKPGFIVSIDISHKLTPILRTLSNSHMVMLWMMASTFFLSLGCLMIVGIEHTIIGAIIAILIAIIGTAIILRTEREGLFR